jgi:serine/threonine protein kinase
MANGETTPRPTSESSRPERADDSSHVFGGEVVPMTTATEPQQSDMTVVSTSPPMEIKTSAMRLSPRELGQALEGQQLDHVLLQEYVGGGGMGAVFRAWDTTLHRAVAVKVLSLRQADDADSLRRFQTEARSAARLDHPNIARAHFVGEDRGVRYIVFEFIEGTNVRDLVYANGPMHVGEALRYTMQIASALSHAWEREVVHRDIKPSNILITPDGNAKLVDMGLARLEFLDQTAQDETATGVTLGTFDYISPEQARSPRDADIRSDIYSLGCTLFFMLAGRPPYMDGTVVQKLLAHQNEAVPDVRELRPDVPDLVASVIATMLAKRPEDRFQNPAELCAALAQCIDELGISAPPIALPFSQRANWAPRRLWWRRHAPWLVPLALLLLSVAALGIKWRSDAAQPAFPELNLPAAETPEKDASRDRETELPSTSTPRDLG